MAFSKVDFHAFIISFSNRTVQVRFLFDLVCDEQNFWSLEILLTTNQTEIATKELGTKSLLQKHEINFTESHIQMFCLM